MPKIPVILQILPELNSGGVERGTLEVAQAILDAGGKAIVVSAGGRLVDRLEQMGATHVTLPVATKNPFAIWKNIAAIKKVVTEYGVHIIHARSRAPAWSAYYAAKQLGVPFLTTFHGTYGMKGLGKALYNNVMVRGVKVIAVSHHIKNHILHHYEVPRRDIRVIHRGVDMEQCSPERVDQNNMIDLVQDWHLEEVDKPIIFFPGRVTRWKGQHIALEALARLKDLDFVCLFAGDSDKHPRYVKELHERVNDYGLELKVRFVPATTHMAEAYHLSSCVLSPAIEPEAFGRIPVEAGAMERIVIATSHGGAQETIKDDETGFLVKPADSEALAEAIRYVLTMPDADKQQMERKARQHIEENFAIAVMQNATLDVYEEIISEHGKRARQSR